MRPKRKFNNKAEVVEVEEVTAPTPEPRRKILSSPRCNHVALLAGWMAVLTVGFCILLFRSFAHPAQPLLIVAKKEARKWHVEFRTTKNFSKIVVPAQVNFEKLLRYDVCCTNGEEFYCNQHVFVSRKGREIYINRGSKAPSPAEERCLFLWAEEGAGGAG